MRNSFLNYFLIYKETCLWTEKNQKLSIRIFGSALEKTDSPMPTSETGENLFLFIICFLWSMYWHTVFLRCGEESNFLLELFKRISKVHEKNMLRERASNVDQSENHKPVRVW